MNIHHIALSVNSLEESISFYTNILGGKEEKRFRREDLKGSAIFIFFPNIQLELWEFDNKEKNKDDYFNLNILGIKHIAFETDNIEELYNNLKDKYEISEPKIGKSNAKYSFLKDPNGFPIELYQKL